MTREPIMNSRVRRLGLGGLLCCLLTLCPAASILAAEIYLPAGDLAGALHALSKQSGAEIVYATEQVKGIQTPEIRGDLTVEEAVGHLLEGTGLLLLMDSSGAMFITSGDAGSDLDGQLNSVPAEAPESEDDWLAPPQIVELVVTARKREESLHHTPVIIQVLAQHDLERAQIHNFFTLAPRVPGFLIGEQNGVLGPGVTLRGVGTTAFNPMIDQSVSLNVDGLQLNQGFAYQAAMFDVGQVEVLKGPQALFFGKNSPAGVISLRSAGPTDETEVILRTGYENMASEKIGEVILSGPVLPSLKLRLAAHFSDHEGFYRNRATAPAGFGVRSPTTRKFAARQNWIVRGTALFEPSDRYDARLKLNFTESQQDYSGGDTQVATCPGGLTSFTGIPFFDPNEDCRLNRDAYISWPDPAHFPLVRNNGVPFIDSRSEFGTFEQNLHFGDLTLTSVTGYYKYRQEQLGNGTGTSGAITIVSDNDFSNRQLTQEVRLASQRNASPVNFLVGGFYQDGHLVNQPRIYANTALDLPTTLRHVIHAIDVESFSAFGQLIWDISDTLELSGGGRWTREKRNHSQFNVASAGVPVGPVIGPDSRLDADNLSPEVSLAWRPSGDLMLFGAYKRGFKSGSFDATSYIPPTTPLSFDDEEVEGFEIGLKTRMLERRLLLNIAAYDYRYTNLQVGAMEVTPEGLNSLRTLNAASAKVRGVDLDATYAPGDLPGLTVRGAVSYNSAHYDSFPNATCGNNQTIAQGCNQLFNPVTGRFSAQDLSGKRLARAPEWSFNAGIDYEIPMDNGMMLTLGGGVAYISEFDTNIIHHRDFVQDAYAKTNASIALSGANDAWEIALVGTNLGNRITSAFCANANLNGGLIFAGQVSGTETGGPAGDDYAACSPERGREIWLRLTLRPFRLL